MTAAGEPNKFGHYWQYNELMNLYGCGLVSREWVQEQLDLPLYNPNEEN